MKVQDTSDHGELLVPELFSDELADATKELNPFRRSFKRGAPPVMGEAFAPTWNDNTVQWTTLPGGGIIGFDLNRLTLADFRIMRDHYQVNASLSVLSFMMHQLQWRVVCENDTIRKFCHENMSLIWTRLVRALSQAFWAGYSPNVLQWENDIDERRIVLAKIKDLPPEEARVNWKSVDGYAPPGRVPPKIKIYDGIKTLGASWPIPPNNTLWYPLLMENGDYYGKKLLRPAFSSWFFSIIIHLFANRYFERYGEPIPVGRAPYEDELDIDGNKVPGRQIMITLLQALRNRSAVVLPDQRTAVGTETKYDYDIEYLESQMRGADFERYLMRLDEEISLALFTPLLMLRTADVGSYNLGTTHVSVYQQMLNALAGDWKECIDHYVLDRMVTFNFGEKAKRARIVFRKLGDDRMDIVKTVLQQLIATGGMMPDLVELGEIAGLTLREIQELTEPPDKPADPAGGGDSSQTARQVAGLIFDRVRPQVLKAYQGGRIIEAFNPSLGYQRQLELALQAAGVDQSSSVHTQLAAWMSSFAGMEFDTVGAVLRLMQRGLESKVDELCEGHPARTS